MQGAEDETATRRVELGLVCGRLAPPLRPVAVFLVLRELVSFAVPAQYLCSQTVEMEICLRCSFSALY